MDMFTDADQVSSVIVKRAMDDLAAADLAVAKYRASHGESSQKEVHGQMYAVFDTKNNFRCQSFIYFSGARPLGRRFVG